MSHYFKVFAEKIDKDKDRASLDTVNRPPWNPRKPHVDVILAEIYADLSDLQLKRNRKNDEGPSTQEITEALTAHTEIKRGG